MFYPSQDGLLIFSGKDCLKFLNSVTTNLVEEKSLPLSTALCNSKGKLINHLTIFKIGELYPAICHMGNPGGVIEYLHPKKLTQEVDIRDISGINTLNYNFAENVAHGVEKIGHTTVVRIKKNLSIWITPISEDIDIIFATDEEWIDWRIQNIYPIYPNELSEKYTPYNCGLDEYVHTGKGCYTGQEILTRMKSRNSFGRTLKVVDNDKLNAEIPTSTGSIASLVISKN